MYPELFRIGDFPINTYGVMLAAGLLFALVAAARLAKNDGLPKERIYDLGLWPIIGGLLGSKFLMFFHSISCVRAGFISAVFWAGSLHLRF
jgi:phosphatidylglycerol:prolipoprotein diacylglycerol transferase